jgi:hypothetical protein
MSARITSITGLQNLTGLVNFYADWNSLTSVNLSNLTNLIEVDVSDQNDIVTDENSLTSVNLTGSTAIEELRLDDSNFSAGMPDISGLTNSLRILDMDQCQLSGVIDLSQFSALTSIDFGGNINITSVTLPEANLDNVDFANNALTATAVDYTLQWLAGSGVENGYVDLSGGTNAIPTENSAAARAILQDRGWNVYVNQAPPGNVGIAASSDFNLVGPFTIEMFVNMSDLNGFPRPYSFGAYPAPNAMSIEGGSLYFWGNQSPILSGPFNPTPGQWYHICILRDGTTIYMFVDGVAIATTTYAGDILSQNLPLTIGYGNEPNSGFNGLMSNFRWSNGIEYNPANFIVPTQPLAAMGNTKLLIFQGTDLNAQLTDNSGNNHNATNDGATYSALSPFVGVQGSLQMGNV